MKKQYVLIPFATIALLSSCMSINTNSSDSQISSIEQDSSSSKSSKEDGPTIPYNQEVNLFRYTFPTLEEDEMPIGAWCAPWNEGGVNHQTDEQYKLIKESGINTIYGLYERSDVSQQNVFKALELAQKYGIGYLARDSRIGVLAEDESKLETEMNKYLAYDSFAGCLIRDEPSQTDFAGMVTGRKAFRSKYSKYCYYSNLFPNYASESQLSGINTNAITYEQYVESYLKTVGPQFLSFDFYGLEKNFPEISDGYFDQLEVASRLADKYKVPFWCFVTTCKFSNNCRIPNEVDMKWQVGSNLVYGAKGIQYFCYMTPYEEPSWGGNMVNSSGEKTEIYDYVAKINKEIASMDEVLMKSSRVAMMKYGNSPSALSSNQEFVTSIREVNNIETAQDILVGVFDHGGKSAYYIFNNSLTGNANLKINFNSFIKANKYSDGNVSEVSGESLNLSLEPAQSILLDLTNYK